VKGVSMKKWLNISLVVLAVVAAGMAFYNKQRQYECLKTEYNEIRSKYKKLLFEKYELPSFAKKVSEEKKKEFLRPQKVY
jgi:Tfp pilus assembly protein PilO